MSRDAAAKTLWDKHAIMWRQPSQIIGAWWDAPEPDPRTFEYRVRGPWWDLLDEAGITLLASREYEHFVLAMNGHGGRGHLSYMPLPHPSGLAVDRDNNRLLIASTRNPNQVIEMQAISCVSSRRGGGASEAVRSSLVPKRTWFFPGSLYLHDLAFIGGKLHGNAVGQNAVVCFSDDGTYKRVWWPNSLDALGAERFDRNYLQLNSIAAGDELKSSFFSASVDAPSGRRPGHRNFLVDKRGVIFGGKTRQPICTGLTRPHSARLHQGQIWVDNSGYGEVGIVREKKLEVVARLKGWTRGICCRPGIAFVGTSRVIPRFQHYAPGLNMEESVCGIHAISTNNGSVLASIHWPQGNQIFAIEWLPTSETFGFPFRRGWTRRRAHYEQLFYRYDAIQLQDPNP